MDTSAQFANRSIGKSAALVPDQDVIDQLKVFSADPDAGETFIDIGDNMRVRVEHLDSDSSKVSWSIVNERGRNLMRVDGFCNTPDGLGIIIPRLRENKQDGDYLRH